LGKSNDSVPFLSTFPFVALLPVPFFTLSFSPVPIIPKIQLKLIIYKIEQLDKSCYVYLGSYKQKKDAQG